jgi:aminoglycoside phosphotransferase (APT) family kinase protein
MTHRSVLEIAHERAGLPQLHRATLLREGENSIWRTDIGIVRISRPGTLNRIRRELQIVEWLASQGFPAVRVHPSAPEPLEVNGFVVTFWVDFGLHAQGTASQVAVLLRRLHSLPAPREFDPGRLDPFVGLEPRVNAAHILDSRDRSWLLESIDDLREQWSRLPEFSEQCLVHGDAWVGNVAQLASGETLLLDLERSSLGPPEWDLVSTAIKQTSFGWLSSRDYREFCHLYGCDVTDSEHFELLRDLRELRMTTYALQRANNDLDLTAEASFRLRCLQGREGERPWAWTPTS